MMSRSILKLLIMVSLIFAQNNVATTSAAFLEIGPGARSLGMGSAYVSVANDASSLYWNPAGIVNVSRPEVQSFYTPWLVETQYYYNTAVVPLGPYGNLGFSFTAITMDEMIVRTVQDPEPSDYGQKFDAGNISMGIAYAKKLTDRFSFGFQTKFNSEFYYQGSLFDVDIEEERLKKFLISTKDDFDEIVNHHIKKFSCLFRQFFIHFLCLRN